MKWGFSMYGRKRGFQEGGRVGGEIVKREKVCSNARRADSNYRQTPSRSLTSFLHIITGTREYATLHGERNSGCLDGWREKSPCKTMYCTCTKHSSSSPFCFLKKRTRIACLPEWMAVNAGPGL